MNDNNCACCHGYVESWECDHGDCDACAYWMNCTVCGKEVKNAEIHPECEQERTDD